MTKHLTILSALAMASLAMLVIAPLVHAQDSGSIMVQPSTENISVSAGQSLKKSLLIVNSGPTSASLKIFVKDAKTVDQTGKVSLYIANNLQSALNWLVPQYTLLTIPGLSSARMDYLVAPTAAMAAGGYAGAISFQRYDLATKKVTGDAFGILVYLNVLGKGITTGGSISSFATPLFQYRDPAVFSFAIKNDGNSNLLLAGTIAFKDVFGRQAGQFDSGQLEITPGATRRFDFSWKDAPLFGLYKGQVTLTDALRKDHVVSGSTWFLFLPWQYLLPAVLVLAALIGFVLWNRRRRVLRKDVVALSSSGVQVPVPVESHSAVPSRPTKPKKPKT